MLIISKNEGRIQKYGIKAPKIRNEVVITKNKLVITIDFSPLFKSLLSDCMA